MRPFCSVRGINCQQCPRDDECGVCAGGCRIFELAGVTPVDGGVMDVFALGSLRETMIKSPELTNGDSIDTSGDGRRFDGL
jgi:hypothetical protein